MKLPHLFSTALLTVLALASVGHAADNASPNDFLIVPGVRAGLIDAQSREAGLRKVLGFDQVRTANIPVGEGDFRTGTVLYPADPTRRVEILWRDQASKRRPEMVRVSSGATAWHTAENIAVGTPLSVLEGINGRPVHLTGFNFDDAGTVTDGGGGTLKYLGVDKGVNGIVGRQLVVRFDKTEEAWNTLSALEKKSVTGNVIVPSSLPAVRKLAPTLSQIIVEFPNP